MTTESAVAMHQKTVYIHPQQQADFDKKMASLNKKADRFGLPPITVTDTSNSWWTTKSEALGRDGQWTHLSLVPLKERELEKILHPIRLLKVELDYPVIKLGDWEVVGKLEAMEGGNLLFAVTKDAQDQAKVHSASSAKICCEHCGTNRIRKESFILKSAEDSDYKQVGTSCLEDFTGVNPAAALFLAHMDSFFGDTSDDLDSYGSGSSGPTEINTVVYLAVVSHIADKSGFMTRAKAEARGIPSTADEAMGAILSKDFSQKFAGPAFEYHIEKAKAIREWVKTLDSLNPFNQNCQLLLAQECLSLRSNRLGFAAATILQYNLATAQKLDQEQSVHIGAPGEKMTGTLTVKGTHSMDSQYGPITFVTLADPSGNILKWKTGSCPDEIKQNIGKSFEGQFKIKDHSEFRGTKETSVTHLKVKSWVDLEPEEPATIPLEEKELYFVVKFADKTAFAEWPDFLPPKSAEPMEILKAYAEDASSSGMQDKDDQFAKHTSMKPYAFLQHYPYLSELYAEHQSTQASHKPPEPESSASPATPFHSPDNDAPVPF